MQRRLTAIMVVDVVGSSRLMEADEAASLSAIRERWSEIVEPLVNEHSGRIVKYMGDGVLAEFASAVKAVECGLAIQERMASANEGIADDRRIVLRIGINVGDVVEDGSDIFGDGVNVAARIEAFAEPGNICITGTVYEAIRGKIALPMENLGEKELKNITRLVTLWRLGAKKTPATASQAALTLPAKPSIAVLPFTNMSGDPEQEYFADGMAEDIITALSRFHGLFVIARNSSFTYKGKAVDLKQVGRELGVAYLLEGSVRKSGNRLRITGQLIDASSGSHLWADRFDGELEDVFELQDRVTKRVVADIAPKLEEAGIERSRRKPTASLDAYDYFLRGMASFHEWSKEANNEALSQFYKAIRLDSAFASAYGMAAMTYVQRSSGGWTVDRKLEIAETERLALQALQHGRDNALALGAAGFAFSDILNRIEEGDELVDRALNINPNFAWGWLYSSWIKTSLGDTDTALQRVESARRLSPNDPHTSSFNAAAAMALLLAGRYRESLAFAELATRDRPRFLFYNCIALCSASLAGESDAAMSALHRIYEAHPHAGFGMIERLIPIRMDNHREIWREGLLLGGLKP